MRKLSCFLLFVGLFAPVPAFADDFAKSVADTPRQAVVDPITTDARQGTRVPFLTWGGDMVTFYANGGLKTTPNSIYGGMGLNLELVNGDNFKQQVRDCLSGKSPFVRGTDGQEAMASAAMKPLDPGSPDTRLVPFFQLTFSVGDHCVATRDVKRLEDFKGCTAYIQSGGPHVKFHAYLLETANLKQSDVKIVWCDDLTGSDKAPIAAFTKAAKAANGKLTKSLCFCISPDMTTLTGGLNSSGSEDWAEGNVPGAHVVASTSTFNHAIADVYAARKDWYDTHTDTCKKFFAGYVKAAEYVAKAHDSYTKKTGDADAKAYADLLQMAQNIFGKAAIPQLSDANGLYEDCRVVGLAGNISWYKDSGNLQGFDSMFKSAVTIMAETGFLPNEEMNIVKPDLDYKEIADLAGVEYKEPKMVPRIKDAELSVPKNLDDSTLASFTINFDFNQTSFDAVKYSSEFDRVLKQLALAGNSAMLIRAHSDPGKALYEIVKVGQAKGLLQVSGSDNKKEYYYKGQPLNIASTKELCAMIENGEFDGSVQYPDGTVGTPRQTVADALELSKQRDTAVKDAIVEYAKNRKINVDLSQIRTQAVGISEPLIACPRTLHDMAVNRRVEFRLIKVSPEAVDESVLSY